MRVVMSASLRRTNSPSLSPLILFDTLLTLLYDFAHSFVSSAVTLYMEAQNFYGGIGVCVVVFVARVYGGGFHRGLCTTKSCFFLRSIVIFCGLLFLLHSGPIAGCLRHDLGFPY